MAREAEEQLTGKPATKSPSHTAATNDLQGSRTSRKVQTCCAHTLHHWSFRKGAPFMVKENKRAGSPTKPIHEELDTRAGDRCKNNPRTGRTRIPCVTETRNRPLPYQSRNLCTKMLPASRNARTGVESRNKTAPKSPITGINIEGELTSLLLFLSTHGGGGGGPGTRLPPARHGRRSKKRGSDQATPSAFSSSSRASRLLCASPFLSL
jgi:hypothetical protein